MKSMFKFLSFAAILAVAASPAARATETYNSSLGGPGAYFGIGNPDSSWAVNTDGTVQLGLKAQTRGVASPIVPSDNNYSVTPGPGAPNRFTWNFDFSVNTGGAALNAYTYLITITDDAHPSITNTFDPSTISGDALANSSGPICNGTTQPCTYNGSADDGFQNSENLAFGFLTGYDINSTDELTITLSATNVATKVVTSDVINVVPTPEPSSLVLLGSGLMGVAGKLIRRRRTA